MTEKDYSGASTSKIGKNAKSAGASNKQNASLSQKLNKPSTSNDDSINDSENISEASIKNYKKAGEIAKQVKEYAKTIIKKDILLSEIAEKIEAKIIELKGELAFPVNLSIDDVAAHYTPTLRDDKTARGLLKADIGVHVNGCICDIAFTLDLTPEKKHQKIIEASEKALKSALEIVKKNKEKTTLSEIGAEIEKSIKSSGFTPIVNLSGHSLSEFEVHSGLTIPNINNSSNKELGEGAFAIEPFATLSSGSGAIYEGAGSNIFHITKLSQPRDSKAREVFEWIAENKKMLPFSKREVEKKFGIKALIALSQMKQAGIIEEYPQLIEKSHSPVSQSETSLIVHSGKVEILAD